MKQQNWQRFFFNVCIVLNCLLAVLLIFGSEFVVPPFLQAFGRAHPLLLHFPIVLLLLAFLFEMLIVSPKQITFQTSADWMLLAAVLTTVSAALMGLFLSKEGGYESNDLTIHKWTGVMCAFISFTWYTLKSFIRKSKLLTAATGIFTTVILLIAGHKGAGITHGEEFLLSPLFATAETAADISLDDAVVYTHLVQPIIEKKCMSCHNTNKAKGELIMATRELLLKGGKSGKLWDTSAVDLGLMMQRIHLPADHKEHMPPEGKPQLTDEEARILYLWIKGGASFTAKVTELPASDSLRLLAATFFKSGDAEKYDFEAADESAVSRLNTEYRIITPLATGSPALSVNFYGVSQFKGAQLAELSSIKNNIVSLHLGGMPVKDEDLKTIGEFVNLRDLNLTFTKINGEGLKYLSGLQHLRQISLSGTGIHINRLRPLAQLKNLRSVSLWNTSIDNKDMASLKNSFPRVSFDLGYKGDTVVAVLAPPVIDIDEEKRVFDQSLSVVLKSPVSAAKIRYTTDGSEPDSISSPLYKKPINIDQSLIIKARAFLPDWISSKTVSVSFYKNSIKADSIYLTTLPEQKFVADARNGNAFTDQLLGTADAGAANWIGYKLNDFAAFLLFKKAVVINSITFGTLIDVSRTIFPPAEIQVWGGADSGSLKLLATVKPAQPTVRQPPYITGIKCILPSQPVKMIKLVAKRVLKIPVLKNPVPNEQQASKQQLKAKSANKQQQPKAPKSKRPKANPAGVIYFDEILLN